MSWKLVRGAFADTNMGRPSHDSIVILINRLAAEWPIPAPTITGKEPVRVERWTLDQYRAHLAWCIKTHPPMETGQMPRRMGGYLVLIETEQGLIQVNGRRRLNRICKTGWNFLLRGALIIEP